MPSILLHREKLQASKTPRLETVGDFGRLAGELGQGEREVPQGLILALFAIVRVRVFAR
jgi:hypothetical protein